MTSTRFGVLRNAEFCHWWKIDHVIDDDLQAHDDVNIDDKKEMTVNKLTNKNALFSMPNHKQTLSIRKLGFPAFPPLPL